MHIRFIIPVLIFIPVTVLQLTVVPLISIDYIAPDLIIILLVFYTLRNGQIYGSVLGFIFGLLFDLASGGLIGSSMFSKTLAGFIAGYFYNEKNPEVNYNAIVFVSIVLVCSSVDSLFFSLLAASETNITIFNLFFQHSIFPGVYTSVLALPIIIFKPVSKLL